MKPVICLRCSSPLELNPMPVGYCGACAAHFKDVLRAADARAVTRQSFADGKFVGVRECPVSVVVRVGDMSSGPVCGVCGSAELTDEYGHCPFGCGTYTQCHTCRCILNFKEDTGG